MRRHRDPLTKDLFSWEAPKVAVGYSSDVTGRGALENKIARLVGHALRDAREERGATRSQIAKAISDYIGRSVSEAMLNKWSSEASEDHRIPLDVFMGLIHATGAMDLLGFLPGEFGMTVIETSYADLIEDQLLAEHEEEVKARRQVLASRRKANR